MVKFGKFFNKLMRIELSFRKRKDYCACFVNVDKILYHFVKY